MALLSGTTKRAWGLAPIGSQALPAEGALFPVLHQSISCILPRGHTVGILNSRLESLSGLPSAILPNHEPGIHHRARARAPNALRKKHSMHCENNGTWCYRPYDRSARGEDVPSWRTGIVRHAPGVFRARLHAEMKWYKMTAVRRPGISCCWYHRQVLLLQSFSDHWQSVV